MHSRPSTGRKSLYNSRKGRRKHLCSNRKNRRKRNGGKLPPLMPRIEVMLLARSSTVSRSTAF
jgi:hypothetical protein